MDTKLETNRTLASRNEVFDASVPVQVEMENNFIPHLATQLFRLFSSSNDELTLEEVLKIVCNWSVGMSIEQTINALNVKKEIVQNIYGYCLCYARSISSADESKLGGECSLVIVDIYPYGCEKFGYQIDRTDSPLFCAAEIKNTPPRYLFDIMSHDRKSEERDSWLVQTIRETIRPLSTIVVDVENVFFEPDVVNSLRNMQFVVVSLESLKKHDTHEQSVLDNLQTIWTPAMDIYDIPFFPEMDGDDNDDRR